MAEILFNDWAEYLNEEFQKPYYLALRRFLVDAYRQGAVYPDMHDIFNALHLTSYRQTSVVILGQDPYHGPGQAHGLCFSVRPGVPKPPSLQNIFLELQDDLGYPIPVGGNLTPWAEQGVLLLNTTLTVAAGKPKSHAGQGWEIFTDRVIEILGSRRLPTVFILWGAHAQSKRRLINKDRHMIIASPHPSPLSSYRGFFGSKPFSRANDALEAFGRPEIYWQIVDKK